MSASLVQPHSAASWKQEVNLRLAAHRSRRGLSAAPLPAPAPSWSAAGSRGAQAAARVAARYAHAPSYSQLQAAEAHAALTPRTERALHAVASVAAAPRPWEPEALTLAPPSTPDREPAVMPLLSAPHALPASLEAWESEYSHIRPEPDPRMRPIEPVSAPAALRASWPEEGIASADEDGWKRPEPVEPEPPIHANLIRFPRELVAVRKLRPRRIEGPLAFDSIERQLSIFEVDPAPLSIQPETPRAASASAWPESAWPEPAWSGLKLEAQPHDEPESEEAPAAQPEVQLAPIGHRLMAVLVDGALIAALFLGSAMVALAGATALPAARIMEICAVAAFLLVAMVYQTLFLTLAETTPGMKFAGISLCTFDGQIPTPAQLRSRLGALLLSVVPVGLGLAWALFDDDHLCWHDRLSRTYLRKN